MLTDFRRKGMGFTTQWHQLLGTRVLLGIFEVPRSFGRA
jgi:hypothetical protein